MLERDGGLGLMYVPRYVCMYVRTLRVTTLGMDLPDGIRSLPSDCFKLREPQACGPKAALSSAKQR